MNKCLYGHYSQLQVYNSQYLPRHDPPVPSVVKGTVGRDENVRDMVRPKLHDNQKLKTNEPLPLNYNVSNCYDVLMYN